MYSIAGKDLLPPLIFYLLEGDVVKSFPRVVGEDLHSCSRVRSRRGAFQGIDRRCQRVLPRRERQSEGRSVRWNTYSTEALYGNAVDFRGRCTERGRWERGTAWGAGEVRVSCGALHGARANSDSTTEVWADEIDPSICLALTTT